MKAIVFLGPTLRLEEARAELDALYWPPVAQGDVYRATLLRADVIGIIDGYFHRVGSVWHKEILWALSSGIRVLGASSMGALRAAEMVDFGMEGVGEIFAAFRSGVLEDDDEVAVAHGMAEHDYRSASVAMVNIRATLRAAETAKLIASECRTKLERVAKAMFYPHRSYGTLLERAGDVGVSAEQTVALRDWLRHGQVDQKKADALELLRRVRDASAVAPIQRKPKRPFEPTAMWRDAVQASWMPLDMSLAEPKTADVEDVCFVPSLCRLAAARPTGAARSAQTAVTTERLARHQAHKLQLLTAYRLTDAVTLSRWVPAEDALRWYGAFMNVPAPTDVEAHARSQGFATGTAFLTALRREYVYQLLANPRSTHVHA